MRGGKISPVAFEILVRLERRGPMLMEDMVGWTIDGQRLTLKLVRREVRWLWDRTYLAVDCQEGETAPFRYQITELGIAHLASVRDGVVSADQQKAAINRLREQYGAVAIFPDPENNRRTMCIPYVLDEAEEPTEELDLEEARWIYTAGTQRHARSEDAERLTKGKEDRHAA